MMGRFRRSLYVGRITEYLFLVALAGAIVKKGGAERARLIIIKDKSKGIDA
jgi:hypothetical protein